MSPIKQYQKEFIAAAQLYLSLSILFGTWVIYIPQITEKLNMSEGQLGLALFFGAIGSLAGTFMGKPLTSRFGEGIIALVSITAQSIAMVGMFLAPSIEILSIGLFFYGMFGGNWQVAVNSMVIVIEKKHSVSIMSKCHGFFSLGALIASGAGTLLMVALNNAFHHALLSAALVIGLQLATFWIYKSLKVKESKPVAASPMGKIKKNGILTVLSLIGISAMVTEGAIADWSGLYLQDVINANKNLLGLGFAGFSLSMTAGRFFGDYFSKRYGAIQIVIGGFLLSLLGFLFVFIPNAYAVIFGFFIVGIGFSTIVPVVYRLSANLEGINPASGIAFIAGASYVGFLAGPVILGVLAEKFGLSISFMLLFGLVSMGALLTIGLKVKSKLKFVES